MKKNLTIKKFGYRCMDNEGNKCGYLITLENGKVACDLFGIELQEDKSPLNICGRTFGGWYHGRP